MLVSIPRLTYVNGHELSGIRGESHPDHQRRFLNVMVLVTISVSVKLPMSPTLNDTCLKIPIPPGSSISERGIANGY